MTTTVVHISQPYDVYIGRAGKGTDGFFGNPHPLNKPCPLCEGTVHARGEAIAAFAQDFAQRIETDPDFRQRVLALKGKRLGCFCKPRFACHGDVYVDWLERPAAGPVATTPPAVTEIREFKGEYAWASNFFPSPITWQGYAVATVEHGYHLDKPAKDARGLFPDPAHPGQMIEKPWRQAIAEAPTPAAASRPLVKIISGGQTGADQAGLFTAEAFGIPTGGWAPKGWLTSVGPKPALLRDRFRLEEHTGGYPQRTVANAKAADGTIRLASDFTTGGERCTLRAIQEHHKPWFDVDLKNPPPVAAARAWIQSQNIRVLNVAGNREHPQTPGTFRAACFYLRDLLVALGYDRIPRAAA